MNAKIIYRNIKHALFKILIWINQNRHLLIDKILKNSIVLKSEKVEVKANKNREQN